MTTLSDTPGEGLDVDRAIELAWNMARFSSPTDRMYWEGELRAYLAASPSVASDTAALPSGYEGLVADLRWASTILASRPCEVYGLQQTCEKAAEAIAALGRVQPVAEPEAFLVERLEGTGYGPPRKVIDARQYDPRRDDFWVPGAKERHRITSLYATPPAPQPALSAQGEAAQPAAEGWQMVPKRVTPEMIDAHFKAHAEATSVFAEVQSIWAHMLAAAPASPTTMHGPYGWLIMPEGLNEEHWHLADEPEPGTPSEPLFARRDMLPASPAASQDGGTDQ